MSFTLAVTQAPQHSFANGGATATARQYYARETQHTLNGPRVASAVSGMSPGDFVTIYASATDEIFRTRLESTNGGFDVLDWTPRAVWDAATEQIILGGRRGNYKIYAYSDVTGDWRELPLPAGLGRALVGTAHYYGMIAGDSSGGVYLGTTENTLNYRLDPSDESYTAIADHLVRNGNNGSMLAWDEDYSSGTGALFKYTGDAHAWLRYDPGSDTWTQLATGLSHGMHALVEYHAASQRFLIVGGSSTEAAASLVTEAGVETAVTAVPQDIAMSSGSWVVAHPDGCWLVRCTPATGSAHIYAAWPNAAKDDVTWQDLGVAPDDGLTYSTAAVDSARGLVYIVSTTGLHAYAFPTVVDPFAVTPTLSNPLMTAITANGGVPRITLTF